MLKSREKKKGVRGARRRLSVVSDNKLIEGYGAGAIAGEQEEKASMSDHVVKVYAGASKKGYAPYNPKKRNQDAMLMEEDRKTGTLLFGVFDGHGETGDLVSHFFTDRLGERVFKNKNFSSDPGRAMREETAYLEKKLLQGMWESVLFMSLCSNGYCCNCLFVSDSSIDTDFSGSTGVMATIRGKDLVVANIGDSRIILGRQEGGKLKAVPVSDDHKPDREDEKKRIIAHGGRVFAVTYDDGVDGPPRVWLGHMDIPGLAMARSLGDTVAHTVGVSSEPEMHHVTLSDNDRVIVLASDGLWEFMSNQEVIDIIAKEKEPQVAVDKLVKIANAKWMEEEAVIDDTTIIVAYM